MVSFLWVGLSVGARQMQTSPPLAWILCNLLPAGLALLITVVWLRRQYPGVGLSLGFFLARPSARVLWLALVAGIPATALVGWWAITQPGFKVLSIQVLLLTIKLLLNQAMLEEWLSCGFLLGGLVASGVASRRAIWISAVAFAFMHLLQYSFPPYNAERFITGFVLVVVTLPLGLVTAYITLGARSIWPAVLLHFLVDLTILPQKQGVGHQGAILLAGVVIPAVLVWIWSWRERRRTR